MGTIGEAIDALIELLTDEDEPSDRWTPYPDDAGPTGNQRLECGEERVVYRNREGRRILLKYELENRCEFSAWWWVETAGGTMRTPMHRIPGGQEDEGSVELEPNERLVYLCTWVQEVDGDGCTATYRALAFQ